MIYKDFVNCLTLAALSACFVKRKTANGGEKYAKLPLSHVDLVTRDRTLQLRLFQGQEEDFLCIPDSDGSTSRLILKQHGAKQIAGQKEQESKKDTLYDPK